MPITPKQIIQISNLARIKIEKDQVHILTEKIGEIILKNQMVLILGIT